MPTRLHIGFLLYPQLTQLDLTGPAQVFATAQDTELHFVAADLRPVPSDAGLSLMPTTTFAACPPLDVLCVPGGPGQMRRMQDPAVLDWLRRQGGSAAWVTSVCSGSLLLGAAGLLKGYRAASHWHYRPYLTHFGAVPDEARVVRDRNRLTGGGVTAGIDLALRVVAELRGEAEARQIELLLEYAPEPPFGCGRPEQARADEVQAVAQRLADAVERVEQALT
jgi:cyclohexyl-isocyanide hydratase